MNNIKILIITALVFSVGIGAYSYVSAEVNKAGRQGLAPTMPIKQGDWNKGRPSTSTMMRKPDDIRFSTSTPFGNGFRAINGTVSSVGTSTMTVTSENKIVYTVNSNASTTILKVPNTTIQLSDIKIGDRVNIQGNISSTTVSAVRIMDITLGQGLGKSNSSIDIKPPVKRSIVSKIKNFFGSWFRR